MLQKGTINKGMDFNMTYSIVARLEAMRMLLAFSHILNFKTLSYRCRECVLEYFYLIVSSSWKKLSTIYACRAWHNRLIKVMPENKFQRDKFDIIILLRKMRITFYLCKYMSFVFGATNGFLCEKFFRYDT